MAMRGEELSKHILVTAKIVFLEMGFERTSMDVIAERAETSKRTLYAHFENKEKLYFAVIELVRSIYLNRLGTPAEHSPDREEAIILFSHRFFRSMLYVWTIRMCRLSISVAERFREGSALYFDTVFNETQERLSRHIAETYEVSPAKSSEAARAILGDVIFPAFTRTLFGVDEPAETVIETIDESDPEYLHVKRVVGRVTGALAETSKKG